MGRAADYCFVCGPENPVGLRLRFRQEGQAVAAEFVPREEHVGWQGVVHGGILAAVLDDAMGNVFYLRGYQALTARMEVRFRRPVRPGDRLRVRAWVAAEDGRTITARAELERDGEVVCSGEGVFLRGSLREVGDAG